MTIVPLFGHEALAARLQAAARSNALPASILLHGPAGVGKQRLALHLASALLCTGANPPCGECQGCRYMRELTHPDLHWYFPRPRLKAAAPDAAAVDADIGSAIEERRAAGGLYPEPPGSDGIHIATVRAIVRHAGLAPAVARRKVFIVGQAERMSRNEGQAEAANAFLKLLEEPPDDTTILLTTAEPGSLLPTILSRVVTVRVPRLAGTTVRDFLEHPGVRQLVSRGWAGTSEEELVRLADGAPGYLLTNAGAEARTAATLAHRLMEAAASGSRARLLRTAAAFAGTRARSGFTATLEQLAIHLRERLRDAVASGSADRAIRITEAIDEVETARARASGNVNPQLAGTSLARKLAAALR